MDKPLKPTDAELSILGGVRHGVTMGGPIALMIGNSEWPKWEEVMSPDPVDEALIEGGKVRVRPILMTALATILALIPLAVSRMRVERDPRLRVLAGGLAALILCGMLLGGVIGAVLGAVKIGELLHLRLHGPAGGALSPPHRPGNRRLSGIRGAIYGRRRARLFRLSASA